MSPHKLATFHSSHGTQPNHTQLLPTGRIKLMQEIPYDVWRCITDFLSTEEVKRLYSVNRSLLNISMDERYRIGYIGSLFDKVTERNINRLIDPEVSSRVREFTFKPGHLCRLLHENRINVQSEGSPEFMVTGILKAFNSMGISPRKERSPSILPNTGVSPMPVHLAYKNVLKMLEQMVRLMSLRVELSGGEYWYFLHCDSTSFFTIGWMAFGSNLRSLDLSIPLEAMGKVLPPLGQVTLTNLETLSLQIIRASLVTDASAMLLETVLPFINAHRSKLRFLTLNVAEQTNLSTLLLRLEQIVSLQTFKLKQPFVDEDQTDLTGLRYFLQVHRSQLSHVQLDMVSTFMHYLTPYPFFAQSCFGITLPKLLHLSLRLHNFPIEYSEGMVPYIHQFKSTLVSLKVSEHRWSLNRLKALLKGFSPDSPLRELKLSIAILEPHIIEALATSLPDLSILDLDFELIGPEGFIDHPSNSIHRFAYQMNRLVFRKWGLRVLRVSSFQLDHIPRMGCKLALLNALPEVQTICGHSRSKYISDEA